MPDAVLYVENLRKEYRLGVIRCKRVVALDGITMSLHRGEIFGLLGPNGAGKTTLVKIVCGLVQATSGDVYIQGYSVSTQRRKCVSLIGAVLEGNRNVYWNLTPVENLRYFASLRGVPRTIANSRIRELLMNFDLWEKRDMLVGSLSRGMQQKLSICCALIADPSVLLLDEPALGLDVAATVHITTLLKSLVRDQDKAVLLTTHDMQLAAELSDRIAVINHGKLVKTGTPQEFLDLLQKGPWRIVCENQLPIAPSLRLDLAQQFPRHSILEEGPDAFTLLIETSEAADQHMILYDVLDLLRRHEVKVLSVSKQKGELKDAFLALTQKESSDGFVDLVRG